MPAITDRVTDEQLCVRALRDIITILQDAPNCSAHPMEAAFEIGRAIGAARLALIQSGNHDQLPERK